MELVKSTRTETNSNLQIPKQIEFEVLTQLVRHMSTSLPPLNPNSEAATFPVLFLTSKGSKNEGLQFKELVRKI